MSASFEKYRNIQFYLLLLISVSLIVITPEYWNYTPDGGIYLGTAKQLLETGEYAFNFHPNILYYPGVSLLLTVPISIFGMNFYVLHLFALLFSIAAIWLVRAYYSTPENGLPGILVPILLIFYSEYLKYSYRILSDIMFISLVFAALLLWKSFIESGNKKLLAALVIVIAYSTLVRFHGVFLVAAFSLAYLIHLLQTNRTDPRNILVWLLASALAILPFLLWSVRNYIQHDPDTYTMFNQIILGLDGLSIYSPDWGKVDWIDASWKYGVYNLLFTLQSLAVNLFGADFAGGLSVVSVLALFTLMSVPGAFIWIKKATLFEIIFAGILLAFALYSHLKSHNLYSVTRYWLPILPFLLLMWGFTLQLVIRKVRRDSLKNFSIAIVILLLLPIFATGLKAYARVMSNEEQLYFQEANQTLQQMRQFMKEHTDQRAAVAATDWGVLPLVLQRETYQLSSDKNHLLSIDKMLKYQTAYLVIFEGASVFHPYAFDMVKDYPQAFEKLLEIKLSETSPRGEIYKVNLAELEKIVEPGS